MIYFFKSCLEREKLTIFLSVIDRSALFRILALYLQIIIKKFYSVTYSLMGYGSEHLNYLSTFKVNHRMYSGVFLTIKCYFLIRIKNSVHHGDKASEKQRTISGHGVRRQLIVTSYKLMGNLLRNYLPLETYLVLDNINEIEIKSGQVSSIYIHFHSTTQIDSKLRPFTNRYY